MAEAAENHEPSQKQENVTLNHLFLQHHFKSLFKRRLKREAEMN